MTISETHSDYTGYGVSCNGASDGSIDVTVTGGTGNYTYAGWLVDQMMGTTEDVDGLGAGTYSVTATDENGCSVSISKLKLQKQRQWIFQQHGLTIQVMEFHVMEQVMVLLM